MSIFILDPLAGKMIGYYDIKLDKLRSKEQSQVLINDNGYWMRQATLSGHQIIKAVSVSNNGQILHQVTIFNYDKNGLITERFFSENTNFFRKKVHFLAKKPRIRHIQSVFYNLIAIETAFLRLLVELI